MVKERSKIVLKKNSRNAFKLTTIIFKVFKLKWNGITFLINYLDHV